MSAVLSDGPSGYPKVGVVILNWNGWRDTVECLESLKHVTYPTCELVVVDNGSTDESVDMIQARLPSVQVIRLAANGGYASGNNAGVRWAANRQCDYVLLTNNDVVYDPGFLECLVGAAMGTEAAATVPAVYSLGETGEQLLSAGGDLVWWRGGAYHRTRATDTATRDVSFLPGCVVLLSIRALQEAGSLCEDYFLYYEDADYSVRLSQLGLRMICAPASRVWHKVGAGSGDSAVPLYYNSRNRVRFLRKHCCGPHQGTGVVYTLSVAILKSLVWSLTGRRRCARVLLRAVRAGLVHATEVRVSDVNYCS